MYIWCHMSWIWFCMWFHLMISHAHFIWKISINHIWFHTCQMDMKSYVISYASSRLPGPVQKRPRSGSNAPLFESNAAAPRPLRLSVLFHFEIRLQWFIGPYKASRTLGQHPPLPASETLPSLSSCTGAWLSDFGAAAYHSTVSTSLRPRKSV